MKLLFPKISHLFAWGMILLPAGIPTRLAGQVVSSATVEGDPPTTLDILLIDQKGDLIRPGKGEISRRNIPADRYELHRQIPHVPFGSSAPEEVMQRIWDANRFWVPLEHPDRGRARTGFEWFPGTPIKLQPYFKETQQFGTTALKPGALIAPDPISTIAQDVKTELARVGLTYHLPMGFTHFALSNVLPGKPSNYSYFNLNTRFNLAIFNSYTYETTGSITTKLSGHRGLDRESREFIPLDSTGTIAHTAGNIWGPDGFWLQQLAWQQTFADGKFAIVIGQVDQSDYLDFNTYAGNKNGQFLSQPFANSQVLSLPNNSLGFNLQWQPCDSFYATFGAGTNNGHPGYSPFNHLSINDTSYLLELGYVSKDFFGLGKGTYRLQPFFVLSDGYGRPGIALNVEQRLGKESPIGYFGRFGCIDRKGAIPGASAQVATGFNVTGPLARLCLVPRLKNDQLGVGFVWSRPGKSDKHVHHNDEYGIELFYALQLTQTVTVLPDFQIIWDPAYNPADHVKQFAIQVNVTW